MLSLYSLKASDTGADRAAYAEGIFLLHIHSRILERFLSRGNRVLKDPVVVAVAQKHDCTPAQAVLAWLMARDIVVIPKSVKKERMAQNFDVFSFELTQDEMARISALDSGNSLFFSHYDPDTVEWFMTFSKE